MKNFNFEKKVIDVILKTIKKHQLYLTKEENLPQLAKLGFIYNTLWYSGRLCWSTKGLLRTDKRNHWDCDDNPKYKIEMCNPKNDNIESLIYDAWGMHVSFEENIVNWDSFINIVNGDIQLEDWELLEIKKNKTMNDWVKLFQNPSYPYNSMFKTEKRIYDYLLCTIGTGYEYDKESGFIFKVASGADIDKARYGNWKQCKFSKDINDIIIPLLSNDYIKETINATYNHIKELQLKRKKEYDDEIEQQQIDLLKLVEEIKNEPKENNDEVNKILQQLLDYRDNKGHIQEPKIVEYQKYYPISKNYSIITMLDEKTDISILEVAYNIIMDILDNEKQEEGKNVSFAKQNKNKFKKLLGIKIEPIFDRGNEFMNRHRPLFS